MCDNLRERQNHPLYLKIFCLTLSSINVIVYLGKYTYLPLSLLSQLYISSDMEGTFVAMQELPKVPNETFMKCCNAVNASWTVWGQPS